MASSFWVENRYRTHFFCALCGGPFARVYRTDVPPEYSAVGSSDDYDDVGLAEEACNIRVDRNSPLTQEELDANVYSRVESHLEPGEWRGGGGGPHVTRTAGDIRRAYDGRHISERDMRWTRLIRALIHRNAQVQPDGGREQLGPEGDVYLTGRGSVLEDGSWAIAHPSIEDDVGGDDDSSVMSDADDNQYRFHMYQEPDRIDRRFQISSIPFHEECWDIFKQALGASYAARGLQVRSGVEPISFKRIWSYWCDLLPSAMDHRVSDLTCADLATGMVEEPITRFSIACMGGMGYREAQDCGSGKAWLHVPGMHWLAANPQSSMLPEDPFQSQVWLRPQEARSRTRIANHVTRDPFWRLPNEVLIETVRYLSCVDTFCWRAASVPVHFLPIPQKEYRRFFLEEMSFLPALMVQMREYEKTHAQRHIDWQAMLSHASRTWRQDIRLRNRRRIWKIVEPMAEELVERSSRHLQAIGKLHPAVAAVATVARGNVGSRSGVPGQHHTVVFSELFRRASGPSETEANAQNPVTAAEAATPQAMAFQAAAFQAAATQAAATPEADQNLNPPNEVSHTLKRIDVWLHPQEHHVCGLLFGFFTERTRIEPHRTVFCALGIRTAECKTFLMDSNTHVLTGFNVCWARGRLCGLQLILEDTMNEATEYREYEIVSPRYGRWDGPVRRLVAPRKYRILGGVTAFISGAGLIETFAIIEKKKPQRGAGGMLMDPTPDTVPLSHREASLWVCPPPNDVDPMERLGPRVDDWRLRTAECEIFAPTASYRPPGAIVDLTLFSDEDHLIGISFRYARSATEWVHRELGECTGKSKVTVPLSEGEEIALAVVGHGEAGILSLQLVTSLGRVMPACGARYRGTHTIYALRSAMPPAPQEMPGGISFIFNSIIGFHCLYSSKLRRLIQLGIITRTGASRSPLPSSMTTNPSPERMASPQPHTAWPFIEMGDFRYPWVDGAPPRYLTWGRKNSDSVKALKTTMQADYAGWVSLRAPISRIVMYGQMEGIKFSHFGNERADVCFGNTSRSVRGKTRFFSDRGIPFCAIARDAEPSSSGAHSGQGHFLPKIKLLKPSQRRGSSVILEVEPNPRLAAIEFSFTASRIVDWRPLFDYRGSDGNGGRPVSHERPRSWKSSQIADLYPRAEADRDLSTFPTVLVDFFVDPSHKPSVDGVKGYVSTQRIASKVNGAEHEEILTRFCGLRFRRRGLWDEEPLGKMTAYEHSFILSAKETFVSAYYSGSGRHHPPSAFALSTNLGRTTPWFGHPEEDVEIELPPPDGRRAVGIYMAYADPRLCAAVGLIHDRSSNDAYVRSRLRSRLQVDPPSDELLDKNGDMEFAWVVKPTSLPPDYQFDDDFDREPYQGLLVRRAVTFIDPQHLYSIEAYVNTLPGRYGLRALRFRGHREMGTVLLGDWHEDRVQSIPEHKMLIDGRNGERIVQLAMYVKPYDDGQRIISMVITTNRGREHDIITWQPLTNEPPPMDEIRRTVIECPPQHEVVGLNYLTGTCIHEIDFVTRQQI